jgi:hypothetical protein
LTWQHGGGRLCTLSLPIVMGQLRWPTRQGRAIPAATCSDFLAETSSDLARGRSRGRTPDERDLYDQELQRGKLDREVADRIHRYAAMAAIAPGLGDAYLSRLLKPKAQLQLALVDSESGLPSSPADVAPANFGRTDQGRSRRARRSGIQPGGWRSGSRLACSGLGRRGIRAR